MTAASYVSSEDEGGTIPPILRQNMIRTGGITRLLTAIRLQIHGSDL